MNRTIRILACVAILGSAVFTGCEKDILKSHKGEPVKFSAISKGGPTTKTSYAGDSGNFQIIDWNENDLIRVCSDNAVHRYGMEEDKVQYWADYIIRKGPYSINGHESTASLELKTLDNTTTDNHFGSGNGLVWGSAESYKFWGIYPSTDQNSSITITDGENGGVVTATLPVSTTLSSSTAKTVEGITYAEFKPNMNYAYMTASEEVAGDAGEVNLKFYPAFTAIELNLSSADEEFSVSSLTLEAVGLNDYLAGKYTMQAGQLSETSAVTPDASASRTVSATFSSAVALSTTKGVTATFFTIPKKNVGAIKLTVATSKGDATLRFIKKGTKAPYIFEAGHKYRVNLLKVGGRYQVVFGGGDDTLSVEPWEVGTPADIIVE